MSVRLGRFAADAKQAQGLARTPAQAPEFDPQPVRTIFNRDSKWIESYPQAV